ncbi:hypothetical protein [Endozoicomonas acroporae]|uniref:hypothetical protein n=1 Tax=Endozoicomonas acroporae TaxID=1701104 RepID=UPI003D7A757C
MPAIGKISGQSDSTVTGPTRNRAVGQFEGRTTTESDATRQTEINRSFNQTPLLKDRLIYPFYAAKNRILHMAGIGAQAGVYTPMFAASAICVGAGEIIGNTVGRLIKSLFFPNSDIPPGEVGALLGLYTGVLLSIPAAVVLGVFTTTTFAVIGLAGSVLASPFDIYHGMTLADKADLNPKQVRVMDIWDDIKMPELSQFVDWE